MDELILGVVVGTVVALCLGTALGTARQSRERKKRDARSKMTIRERLTIVGALFCMAVALIVGIGAFTTL